MNLKIATWNIDRIRSEKNIHSIFIEIQKIDADILILTEYNQILDLTFYPYKLETEQLIKEPYNYSKTERSVAIFSKFPLKQVFETYDRKIACCVETETPFGNLIVYGTIVGVIGNRDKNFISDLEAQQNDLAKLSQLGDVCYVGDLNMSFSDNYYFTKIGREIFLESFISNRLENTTQKLKENIDHIVISKDFLANYLTKTSEWNLDKEFSDHKGVCVELTEKLEFM